MVNQGFYLTLKIGKVVAEPASRDLIDALVKVQITESAGQRSGFQLEFAAGKSSPIVTRMLPSGALDPPTRVILILVLNGQATTLMDGVITKHDYVPSNEPGQSRLTLTGVDVSQMMDLIDFSGFPWPAMPAEARVALMLAKYAMYGIIPIIVPSPLLCVYTPLQQMPGQQGTDYQYIRKLADETGYVFYVQPGPTPGTNYAYWGPEIKFGEVQPALSVNMDAATNVESLSFSFDGIGKTLFLFYVNIPEAHVSIPLPVPDITPLNPPLGRKLPIPMQTSFLNRASDDDDTSKYSEVGAVARALARASQASDVVSGSGSLDVPRYGRPLKARSLVGVRGAGPTYDGHYFVKSVTHNIQRGQYKQSFTLSRNAQVSLTDKVKV